MTDKEKVSDLLSKKPLYSKVVVDRDIFKHPNDFEDLTFSFYCRIDKSQQTFKLKMEPDKYLRVTGGKLEEASYLNLFETFDEEKYIYFFTQHYSAQCQYCNQYKVNFLLQVISERKIPKNPHAEKDKVKQIISKIGQYPAYEIKPAQYLLDYLNSDDQENYKKALMCISQSYGIGAYAYYRRVVENEIKKIITDISNLDIPESTKIKEAINKYEKNHQMNPLIEEIYQYLPSSLKELGNNPLKILYDQLSGGIHEFTEEECLEKSSLLDTILKFIIKKIKEEKSDVGEVKEALKKLKRS